MKCPDIRTVFLIMASFLIGVLIGARAPALVLILIVCNIAASAYFLGVIGNESTSK